MLRECGFEGTVWRMRVRDWALRPVAAKHWDRLLWASGAVSLGGIACSTLLPVTAELAVLFSITLLIGGPYGLFLPFAYEPVIIVFARLHPVTLVAAVATVGATAVEYVNYRLYSAALAWERLRPAREWRLARAIVAGFRLQPFATVAFCALTPVPFWIARVAAAIDAYPAWRFLLAHAVGRLPRFWIYGSLGMLIPLSAGQLFAGALVASVVIAGGLVVWMRLRGKGVGSRNPPTRPKT